jgi:hypothetical protein
MRSRASRLRSNVLAAVLVLPPLFLLVASILEASDSPMRFDSTYTPGSQNLSYTSVTINCIAVAIIPALTGLWTALAVWKQTRQRFSLDPFFVVLGAVGLLIVDAGMFLMSESKVDNRFFVTGAIGGSTWSVLAVVFLSAIVGGCALGFCLIYSSGIAAQGSGKYDRRPDEPDPLGQMIEERLQDRSLRP